MKWILEGSGGSGRLHDRQRRIAEFMRQHPVGVLSSIDPNGNPCGAAVYYAVDDRFVISILTKKGTRKHDNLLRCNRVMLTVFDEASQATLQASGLAFERDEPAIVTALTRQLRNVARPPAESPLPVERLQAGELTTFIIEPVQIRLAVYAPPSLDNHQELFDTIETFTPT